MKPISYKRRRPASGYGLTTPVHARWSYGGPMLSPFSRFCRLTSQKAVCMMKWVQWVAAWAASATGILGLGWGAPIHVVSPDPAAWRTLHLNGLSMRIPPSWHLGQQVRLSQWGPFSGGENLFRFAIGTPQNSLPPSPHAYLSEHESTQYGQTTFLLGETSVSGTEYDLTVTAPKAQEPLVQRVVHTLKLPPRTTATSLVHHFNARHRASHGSQSNSSPVAYIRSRLGSSRCLLVFGNPATAQEFFVLFHSTDGGRHWSFMNQTDLLGRPPVFPGVLGQPALLFWTPRDGILAEATGFSHHGLWIYRTTNAGYTWQLKKLGPLDQITGATAPRLGNRQGILEVSVKLVSGTVFRKDSTNGGKTWSAE